MRLAGLAMLGLWIAVSSPAAAAPGAQAPRVVEATSLRTIAGWLKHSGEQGYLGADVADAMGIPRGVADDALRARQRGFRNDEVLRIAQVPAEGSEFVLFMVQRPDDQVFFYLSSPREGLKRALVSIPSRNVVAPLDPQEARSGFLREVLYWEDKVQTR